MTLVLKVRLLLSSEHKVNDWRAAGRISVQSPGSRLAAAVVLSGFLLAACGSGEADEELVAARQQSEQALEEVDDLRATLDDVEGDLAAARSETNDLDGRLGNMNDRLKQSIDKLSRSLDELEGSVAGAGAGADDALSAASEAARDISVLGNRLDYHLRNHGG